MCGICAVYGSPDAPLLVREGLYALQHRGQNGAGISVPSSHGFDVRKGGGMVADVDRQFDLSSMGGTCAIGHTRYPTYGDDKTPSALHRNAQPEFVVSPRIISMVHNGNVTNPADVARMYGQAVEGMESECDVKYLLGALAVELEKTGSTSNEAIFAAARGVMSSVNGAYSVAALVKSGGGHKMLAFADPLRLRPCVVGGNSSGAHMVASETTALDRAGFGYMFDLGPGEAAVFSEEGVERRVLMRRDFRPCVFEYIYFAWPSSVIDGQPVAAVRHDLGRALAIGESCDFDVIIPIPDSGKVHAEGFSDGLWDSHDRRVPVQSGFAKRGFRTFIDADAAGRPKKIRDKLDPVRHYFDGRSVCLYDDTLVRGHTAREYVQLAFNAGATEVHVRCSALPSFPCFYGINMTSRGEFLVNILRERGAILDSHDNIEAAVAREMGATSFRYNSPEAVRGVVRARAGFDPDVACLNGAYPTEDGRRLFPMADGERAYEV